MNSRRRPFGKSMNCAFGVAEGIPAASNLARTGSRSLAHIPRWFTRVVAVAGLTLCQDDEDTRYLQHFGIADFHRLRAKVIHPYFFVGCNIRHLV